MNGEFNETEAYNKPDSEEVAYYKNAVEKERKELISFREKLKEAREKADKLEEVIRELIPIAVDCVHLIEQLNMDRAKVLAVEKYNSIIEKAKSLTTKDKCSED